MYDAGTNAYIASATTAAGGTFTFSNLANGNYKVRARSATIGDANTPPKGTLNATVPATWPYPLADMTWGNGAARYGGQSATTDDAATGDNAGPGDTYVTVTVSGADVTGVNLGFAYNLIVNAVDDANADDVRSKQGSLRQFLKNANAVGAAGGTTANSSQFRMQVAANQSSGPDAMVADRAGGGPAPRSPTAARLLVARPRGSTVAPNSNTLGPEIELYGRGGGRGATNGLRLTAGTSTVRELTVNSFGADAIDISGGSTHVIAGNYLGTGATGSRTNLGNGVYGIDVRLARPTT